jgi:RimJ/RimL family protein N-acetyltransferase
MTPQGPVEVRGKRVLLRDPRPEDVEARLRWITVETAWQEWDAPWEGMSLIGADEIEKTRESMLARLEEPLPIPRTALRVQVIDGPLIGTVNQYGHSATHRDTCVGVDVCESALWGRGLGTEALTLWIGYLFGALDLHRISTETWSGNPRMIRCALKCGFLEEGRRRDAREYQGRRYDHVQFGLLRREWEALRAGGLPRGEVCP